MFVKWINTLKCPNHPTVGLILTFCSLFFLHFRIWFAEEEAKWRGTVRSRCKATRYIRFIPCYFSDQWNFGFAFFICLCLGKYSMDFRVWFCYFSDLWDFGFTFLICFCLGKYSVEVKIWFPMCKILFIADTKPIEKVYFNLNLKWEFSVNGRNVVL